MTTTEKAKAFMFVCIGVAALVVAFQMGTDTATGQVGDQTIAGAFQVGTERGVALSLAGDIYYTQHLLTGIEVYYLGNIFESAVPIDASSGSWGNLKGQYGDD